MDQQNGYGKLTSRDGSVYEGNWIENRKDGYGILIKSDGTKYDGFWK